MIKIDLVTGFLGSGKTTFIKNYAKYLVAQGNKIGIIENDYGAINVDMMLLEDELGDSCDLEMVVGGSDRETHQRRFKSKLILMGMLGYNRIIIEPSGIFDTDEFFDILHEEPLSSWYEIGSVITVINASLQENLSKQSSYLFASQVANAGTIIFSHLDMCDDSDIDNTITLLNNSLKDIQCKRVINKEDILLKECTNLDDNDYKNIVNSGYHQTSFTKTYLDKDYDSLFYMNSKLSKDKLADIIKNVMNDSDCGNIFRIKGFIPEDDHWLEFNANNDTLTINPINIGQEIIIIIGEGLHKEKIDNYFK